MYKNKEDMVAQARRILEMPPVATDAVRQQARQRSLNGGYDYERRARLAFEAFKALYIYPKMQKKHGGSPLSLCDWCSS